jgi:protein SCO1/2
MRTSVFFKNDNMIPHDISFISSDEKHITPQQFLNSYNIFFFGYTSCPSFCPEITEQMSLIAQECRTNVAYERYVSNEFFNKINFYFVSIDPTNDTPEQLKAFLSRYNASIIGLTGTQEDVYKLCDYFSLHLSEGRDDTDNHIAHSASLAVLDPLGRACALITTLTDPKSVVSDLKAIQKKLQPEIVNHLSDASQ